MGYEVEQEPAATLLGTKYPIIFTVHDTDTTGTVYKFKYICDIYINGAKQARLKQSPSPNATPMGIFDVSKIANTFLFPTIANANATTESIHFLGSGTVTTKPFSLNDSSLESMILKFGTEEADDATSDPVVDADRITEGTRYIIQAKLPSSSGVNPNLQVNYDFEGNDEYFLTNMPSYSVGTNIIPAYSTDWRTMAFFNNSNAERIYVRIYNAAGVKLNSSNDFFINTTSTGGQDYSSITQDTERLIYVGVGVQNLNAQTLYSDMKISTHATASYYEVFATNDAGTLSSATYRFSLEGDVCKYNPAQFAWKNNLGQWDYFTFTHKTIKKSGATRTTYDKVRGNYADASASVDFSYSSFDRGKQNIEVKARMSATANSGYVTETQSEWLKELFNSEEVYYIDDNLTLQETNAGVITAPVVRPIIITSSSYTLKTSVNDKLINYTIEFEYANEE